VLLELRREYLEQKNNPLGLIYALYGSGDMVIERPSASATAAPSE